MSATPVDPRAAPPPGAAVPAPPPGAARPGAEAPAAALAAEPPPPLPLQLELPDGGALFGHWHRPADPQRPARGALLLVPPLGHEDLALYAGLAAFARAATRQQLAVLRIDLPGAGDASDLPDGADATAWRAACDAAIDTALAALHAAAGGAPLGLLGVRAGACLAAQAALRHPLALLVGLLPVADGRQWLRECRLLDGRAHGAAAVVADPAEGLDLGGLAFPPGAADALLALGWPAEAPPGLGRLLVAERAGLPTPGLERALARWPAGRVERRALAGLDRWLAVAHHAVADPAALDGLAAAAAQALAAAGAGEAPVAACPPGAVTGGLGLTGPRGAVVHERPWHLGAGGRLAGVLATPADGRLPRAAWLTLSSGAERRCGANRLWTRLARERAAAGDWVLRLDLAGLGDSAPRRPGARGDPYDPQAVADIAEAVAALRAALAEALAPEADAAAAAAGAAASPDASGAAPVGLGPGPGPGTTVPPVGLVGLCSGAYQVWRAAVAGLPVERVALVNPLAFHWTPGRPIDAPPLAGLQVDAVQQAVAAGALRALRDPARWRKLLRGEANLAVILRALAGAARQRLRRPWRALRRAVGRPAPQDLRAELAGVLRRGPRPAFVFSPGDPGRAILAAEGGGLLVRALADGRAVQLEVPGADHGFSRLAARQALLARLGRWMDGPEAAR
ncbi:hypothetical protein [Piscinibacter sakaiensis]|uniref:Serine aminopeptidase S33 domain-containing protein n=1 Tax=Piscinibacter sakaiensis TaxID=1547922 RepID=A0A0K8NZR1_PISS1|nr:hypothetical protein [Piscinibacter sakaiensis]GAP35863.1 hypothetical protein ISF6_1636 [Piscinibacter sakaiensis]